MERDLYGDDFYLPDIIYGSIDCDYLASLITGVKSDAERSCGKPSNYTSSKAPLDSKSSSIIDSCCSGVRVRDAGGGDSSNDLLFF